MKTTNKRTGATRWEIGSEWTARRMGGVVVTGRVGITGKIIGKVETRDASYRSAFGK